jgi:hypothetical protein
MWLPTRAIALGFIFANAVSECCSSAYDLSIWGTRVKSEREAPMERRRGGLLERHRRRVQDEAVDAGSASGLGDAGSWRPSLSVHRGKHKAVYCYKSERYDYWKRELLRQDLPLAIFCESFTTFARASPQRACRKKSFIL